MVFEQLLEHRIKNLDEACHLIVEGNKMEAKVEVERLSSGSGNKALGAEPQCF